VPLAFFGLRLVWPKLSNALVGLICAYFLNLATKVGNGEVLAKGEIGLPANISRGEDFVVHGDEEDLGKGGNGFSANVPLGMTFRA
jgi:hypothetical protein